MFAAIITRATRSPPQEFASGETLLSALSPFAQPDVSGVWQDDRALIAQALTHNTPESLHERAPEVCPDTGRVIASWVRLDNRKELCAKLGLEHQPDLTDPQIILAAHRQWGRDCASRLEGDFSFVLYDPTRRETYCARDSLGAKPFFYTLTDEHFIAATSVAVLKAMNGIEFSPNLKWIALFAASLNYAHTESAYENVRKLPAAHDMLVSAQARPEPREYFAFDLSAPHATKRDPQWVEQYREAFDHAVSVRARSQFLIGSEASGGLDSSSVIASLMPVLPHGAEDFHTFAMVAEENEPALLEENAQMCGVEQTHVLMQPQMLRIDDAFDRMLTALGHPPEHAQPLAYPALFDQAHSLGVKTLLSGFGGDEVVTSYAKHLIDELHVRGEYAAVFAEMEGSFPRRAGRFAKRVLRGPDHPDAGMRRLMEQKLTTSCLRRDFLEDSGLGRQIDEWACPDRGEFTLNTLAGLEGGFRYARSGRLESSALYAATYGMEYRYPMLDRGLIQQFFATPSIEKRRGEMGRFLHRRATAGRIPDSIVWQKSKAMGGFISGKLNVEIPPVIAFEELPAAVRSIISADAFRAIQTDQVRDGTVINDHTMRARYNLWQIRQLSKWLAV